MISTQRLIIMLLAIHLTIGLLQDFRTDPTTYNDRYIEAATNSTQDIHEQIKSETNMFTAVKQAATQLYDNTIGAALEWGYSIIKPLLNVVNPFGEKREFDTPQEQAISTWVSWFRVLLLTIAAIEIYMLIKNKKQT